MYGSFLHAVIHANNEELPLKIYPDDIWSIILLQIAKQTNANRTYRQRPLVCIDRSASSIFQCMFGQLIPQFAETITCPFSTTHSNEQILFISAILTEHVEMHQLEIPTINRQHHIPQINIMGTFNDWNSIVDRVKKLQQTSFNSDYFDTIIPILVEFVNVKNGNLNMKFWARIARYIKKLYNISIDATTYAFPLSVDIIFNSGAMIVKTGICQFDKIDGQITQIYQLNII